MKLELRNIKVNLEFSEETTMFKADVYADNVKIAYTNNEGRGGPTFYSPYPKKEKELKEAELYASTLPSIFYKYNGKKIEIKSTLENWINFSVYDYVRVNTNL